LFSCKSDYEKYIDEYKECSEKKKEEKKYKYANIQEALNAYDFEIAREYLACYPDNNGNLNNRTFYNEIFGGGAYDLDPKSKDLEQIVSAEITYFIAQGEFQKAESTAKEADMMHLYEKISGESFENKLDEMIEKKEFKSIFDYLLNKKLVAQKAKYDLNRGMSYNDDYMDAVRDFNANLDKVLNKYQYLKVEKSELKLLIDLSLPELEDKNENSTCGGCEGSKLVDTYKKEATAKYLK
jgi:hypothetical protein